MGFGKWSAVLACCLIFPGMVQAQEIWIELLMPGSMFGPGSTFWLELFVYNPGPALNDAQLFVALTIGTGDFWFFPGWIHYPPDIDWDTIDIRYECMQTRPVPNIHWPRETGEFDGAMFFAAILHNGVLVSNLADVTFGWTEEPVPPIFVYIPPGSFTMGSPYDEPCRESDETQHPVTLTRGFYMMTTEVTRRMWADLKALRPTLPDDPSGPYTSPTMNHPVQRNTWYEAVLFANLMSVQNGYTRCYYKDDGFTTPVDATNYETGDFYCNFNRNGYRLPTEAEWEYACRAGTTGAFSCDEPNYNSGNCESCTSGTHPTLKQYCVYCANDPGRATAVGSKLSNPWNLKDMHGNVFEWCWDWYETYPSGSVTDPTGPSTGSYRVIRGGSWDLIAQICRSAARIILIYPDYRNSNRGFRLVRTAD